MTRRILNLHQQANNKIHVLHLSNIGIRQEINLIHISIWPVVQHHKTHGPCLALTVSRATVAARASIRPSSVNSALTKTTAWIQVTFNRKIPLSRLFFSFFFQIFIFFIYFFKMNFLLSFNIWDPMGTVMSKRYSPSLDSISIKLYCKNVSHGEI